MNLLTKTGLVALTLLTAVGSAPAQYDERAAADVIVGFYQRYLKRSPREFEVATHLRGMRFGGSSLQEIEAVFIASPEYFGRHGNSPTRWIAGMYADAVGRRATAQEVRHWRIRFDQYGGDRGPVAREFLASVRGPFSGYSDDFEGDPYPLRSRRYPPAYYQGY